MATLEIKNGCFFENMVRDVQFVICGCGGTGGYVIRDLARMISLYNEQYGVNNSMLLIDKDDVEQKNLSRQNFISSDIGKNKAEVLAKRYSVAFGIDIDYITEYITSMDSLRSMTENPGRMIDSIFIGCVDNNKTRHIIHNFYLTTSWARAYIDAGKFHCHA